MPSISTRSSEMPLSPIRKLVPLADAAKARGIKIYHLNIGQPDIHTPKIAIDAIRNIDLKVFKYTNSAGTKKYRKKLTEYYGRFGIEVNEEQILVTSGGSEAFNFAFLCCFNPGDEIIIPEPFYANYQSVANAFGIKIVPISSTFEDDFSLPPVKDFEKLITKKTKAIFVCNPNNPTGYLYTQEELDQLRDIVLKHDLFLLSDEVYREFCYDGHSHISAMSLKGLEENVILIDSVSKRYSECGLRIGCMVTKNKQVIEAATKFAQARLSPSVLGQIAARVSLDAAPQYAAKVYEEYIQRRNFLVDGLNKIPGVKSLLPKGAFYTMVKLPVKNSEDFCSWILSDFDYEGKTVMMAPGNGFYSSPDRGHDEVRIAYVLNTKNLQKALVVLEKALEAYPGTVR